MSSPNPPPPNPVNRQALTRASVAGVILAIFGIVLFIVLWLVLGQMGYTQFPRIFLALCLPPAVIALLIGLYVLVMRRRL